MLLKLNKIKKLILGDFLLIRNSPKIIIFKDVNSRCSGLDKCKDTANCGNMLIFGTHIAFSAINHLRNSAHEKNQNGRHFSRWLPFSMKWSDRSCL